MNTLVVNLESNLSIHGKLQGDNMSAKDVLVDGTNDILQLSSATTPDVEYASTDDLVMTGSAQQIDLLDGLTDPEGIALALNTKLVRAIKFRAKPTNTGNITITEGSSNGYELLGDAFKFILKPGQHVLIYLASGAPAIGSTATNIDVTGTLADVLEYSLIAG
jgi:hypothetical protein